MHEKLQAARYHVIIHHGFLSNLIWNVRFIETHKIETMAIDKWGRIYYNPDYLEVSSIKHATTMVVHEIWHLLLKHFDRAQQIPNVKTKIWNKAADFCINRNLTDTKKFELGLMLTASNYGLPPKLIEEAYYKLLIEKNDNSPSPSAGSGSDGAEHEWELGAPTTEEPGLTQAEQTMIRNEVAAAIKRAGINSEGWGDLAEAIYSPKISWRNKLGTILRTSADRVRGKTDYTMGYRNPRQVVVNSMPHPYRMRGFYSNRPKVAVIGDTSASINNQEKDRIATEVNSLIKQTGSEIHWVECDVKVQAERTLRAPSRTLEFKGRGGTDLRKGITHVENLRPRYDILIIMTDCETPWPFMRPSFRQIIILRIGKYGTIPSWNHVLIEIDDTESDIKTR